jgi:hypothetical protein
MGKEKEKLTMVEYGGVPEVHSEFDGENNLFNTQLKNKNKHMNAI